MGSIRKASDQEYWTAIQRLWTFEEPFSRWGRLCKSAAKIASSTYTFDTNAKSKESEEVLFHEIYGPADSASSRLSAFFAICFALAEIDRYQDGAFRYCVQNNGQGGATLAAQSTLNGLDMADTGGIVGRDGDDGYEGFAPIKSLLLHTVEKRSLSTPQSSFLEHCVRSTPDWTRLLENGPWVNDQRVDFIRSVLKEILNLSLHEADNGIADGAVIDYFFAFENIFHMTELAKRSQLPAGFLPKRLLLVEGATEQILLPHFAECIASDWNERAVLVIPAGGANQVVRRYPVLRAQLKLPIDCLLDGDVYSHAQLVASQLKQGDRLYVLESGAIEEAFPRDQIVDLVNAYFDTSGVGLIFTPVTLQELDSATNQESMEKLWRKRNRGSFDKTGFAKVVAESITTAGQIPAEIQNLINDLCAY